MRIVEFKQVELSGSFICEVVIDHKLRADVSAMLRSL